MDNDKKRSREVYLARAMYAEEQAAKASDTSTRRSWLKVASSYRKLAEDAPSEQRA